MHGSSLETRPSLLYRLKTGDDPQSWEEFYRTYGGLIRFFAEKAGLTADEAEAGAESISAAIVARHEFSRECPVVNARDDRPRVTRYAKSFSMPEDSPPRRGDRVRA